MKSRAVISLDDVLSLFPFGVSTNVENGKLRTKGSGLYSTNNWSILIPGYFSPLLYF